MGVLDLTYLHIEVGSGASGSWGGLTPAACLLPLCPRFSQQQAFVQILQEVNDFAGQRELVAENLSVRVCLELAKYSQEMKQERKMVSSPFSGSAPAPAPGEPDRVSFHSTSKKAVGPSSSWKVDSNSWKV